MRDSVAAVHDLVSGLVPGDEVEERHAGHTDVSLWFVLRLARQYPLTLESGEFREARWWSPAEVRDADPTCFDPHFTRFCAKLQRMHS